MTLRDCSRGHKRETRVTECETEIINTRVLPVQKRLHDAIGLCQDYAIRMLCIMSISRCSEWLLGGFLQV